MKNLTIIFILGILVISCSNSERLNDYGFSGSVISKTDTIYNVIYKFGHEQKGEIKTVLEYYFDTNYFDTLINEYDKNGDLLARTVTKRDSKGNIEISTRYVIERFPGMSNKYTSVTTETYSYSRTNGKTNKYTINTVCESNAKDSTCFDDNGPDTYIEKSCRTVELSYNIPSKGFKVNKENVEVHFMDKNNSVIGLFNDYMMYTYEYNDRGQISKCIYSSYDKKNKGEDFYEYEYDDFGNVQQKTIFTNDDDRRKKAEVIIVSHYVYSQN